MRLASLRKIAVVIVLLAIATVLDSRANDVTTRVLFPKGRSTAIFRNRLPRQYAVYHAYVVRARRHQRLTVKLTTVDKDSSFSIYETKQLGPDEDTIFLQDPTVREYTAVLPMTSEYSVQVYGVSGIDDSPSGAAYSIEITLR